ncbi:hypothetical protein [Micromonospora soli]
MTVIAVHDPTRQAEQIVIGAAMMTVEHADQLLALVAVDQLGTPAPPVGRRIGVDLAPPARAPERVRDRLDDAATQVLEALPRRKALALDSVAARAGVDLRTAIRKLSMLEELALVVRRDDGYALAPSGNRREAGPAEVRDSDGNARPQR